MTVIELKNNLNNNVAEFKHLVLKYKDTDFVAIEYLNKIAQIKQMKIKYVTEEFLKSVDVASEDLFGDYSEKYLYALKTDKLSLDITKIKDEIVVICKSIDNDAVKDICVDIPELNEWRVRDYMKVHCSGLTDDAIEWLYKITSGNIYRISNELSKIEIHDKKNQDEVFLELNKDGNFIDLCDLSIFNLTNAITKKDYLGLINCLASIDNIDVEPVGLITILHKSLRNVIDIQLNAKSTAQSLGMSDKQFKAIERNCGKYSQSQLIKMFKFVNDFDYKLKSGKLDMSKDKLIDYIVCGVMSC